MTRNNNIQQPSHDLAISFLSPVGELVPLYNPDMTFEPVF